MKLISTLLAMPRKANVFNSEFPFHISVRCINKEWFTNLNDTWSLYEDYLYLLHHVFGVKIYAFVLMSNHFHLLAKFEMANMSKAMQYFLRETSKLMAKSAGRINQTYCSRYFRSCISSSHYFHHVYKYLYRNPVEAGLCSFVEEYKYSTLHGLLGFDKLIIPVCEDSILFGNVENSLSWLNTKPKEDHQSVLKRALRKSEFKLPLERKHRKPHILEFDSY